MAHENLPHKNHTHIQSHTHTHACAHARTHTHVSVTHAITHNTHTQWLNSILFFIILIVLVFVSLLNV